MLKRYLGVALVFVALVSCGEEIAVHEQLVAIDVSGAPSGVVLLPAIEALSDVFVHYSRVTTPSGRPIHILADAGWSKARIIKARKVLEHILRDAPGTYYGNDKSAVAESMADLRATLVLFETEEALERALSGPLGRVDLAMQDLRANECPIEGSDDYLAHGTRDASYEEIIHLVHDYGIKPALPRFQKELEDASLYATERGIWRGWPDDERENHPNEYLGVLYDNYLDLWSPNPTIYEGRPVEERGGIPEGHSHFGRFAANSRERLLEIDADGHDLIEAFLPPDLTYTPELPESFDGTFSISYDSEVRYTSKARHLTHVTLTGSLDSGLTGNERGNRLTGNAGDNELRGNGGDDELDGGEGFDTAVFSGDRSEYEVLWREDGSAWVEDLTPERDGRDRLESVERLAFSDQAVESGG